MIVYDYKLTSMSKCRQIVVNIGRVHRNVHNTWKSPIGFNDFIKKQPYNNHGATFQLDGSILKVLYLYPWHHFLNCNINKGHELPQKISRVPIHKPFWIGIDLGVQIGILPWVQLNYNGVALRT